VHQYLVKSVNMDVGAFTMTMRLARFYNYYPTLCMITRQPKNVTGTVGENVQLSLKATGAGLTYQWQRSTNQTEWYNSQLDGYDTATMTVPVTEVRYTYYWRCVVQASNGETVVSNTVRIKGPTLAITAQPENVTAAVGETIQFSVTAVGAGLAWQWQNSRDQETWADSHLTGYNTSTLSVPVTSPRYPYYWRCQVTDMYGNQVVSNSAQIIQPT
jgi:plastocyanin